MSKSNLSHINELVSRIAREWCDIEEALKPYLDGQDLLSWISQQEKINPNNEINTDRILRTIAGMQCAVIYSRHRLADHLEGNFSSWEEFLKAVLNKTYEYGSILKFSSAKKLFKYHIDSSCFSNKWTTPLPHPDYEAGMQLGRNHVSGEPDFINFINEFQI